MAIHSSVLAWRIPGMGEPGGLPSMGLHRVGHNWSNLAAAGVSDSKESAYNVGDLGLIPGLGRSPGEGKGYPLQYSGLENSMDCLVHGVAKSRTRLSGFHCKVRYAKSLQSCPTLCDPIDGSPPGSPVPGILQARTLEWIAISFSKS